MVLSVTARFLIAMLIRSLLITLSLLVALVGCRPPEPPAHSSRMGLPTSGPSDEQEMRSRTMGALSLSSISGAREVVCAQRRMFEHALEQLMREVESLVGLTGLEPNQIEVLDAATFQQSAELWFSRHRPREQLEAEGRAFWGMGLLHPTFDYASSVRELNLAGLMSFYDEQERKVYMLEGELENPQLRSSLAIALIHALVDHHYGLATFLAGASGDPSLARLAILDGTALSLWLDAIGGVVEVDAAFERLERLEALQKTQEPMKRMPPFVERLMLFPHFGGARYVYARMAADGEGDRARFFTEAAPSSTAAVMLPMLQNLSHHEIRAELPLTSLGEFEPQTTEYETCLGVFGLNAWLELVGQRTDAVQLTQGWRGDHLWSFKRGENNMLLLHVSLWSTEAEAQAFHEAVDALFQLRYNRQRRYFTETARRGRVVSWMEGLAGEDSKQDKALKQMMQTVLVDGELLP